MKKELAEILTNKFPLLYGSNLERRSMFRMFGFECSEGWYEPIYNLSVKLEALIEKYIEETGDKVDHPRAVQVKEKFGGLRFYMSTGNQAIYDAIDEAEKVCWETCEDCGKPGELAIDGYWYRTLCDECIDKMNKGFIDQFGHLSIRNYIKCSDLKKEKEQKEKNGNKEKIEKEEGIEQEEDASKKEGQS